MMKVVSSSSAIIIFVLCFVIGVSSSSSSSSNPISSAVGLGYEHVATAYVAEDTPTWRAPCFHENTARLYEDPVEKLFTAVIMPHYGSCWTCRDDYQIRLGDQIVSTGSTYFGGVGNPFSFRLNSDHEKEKARYEGVGIYVDMNPSKACIGVSRQAMKNPFRDVIKPAVEELIAI